VHAEVGFGLAAQLHAALAARAHVLAHLLERLLVADLAATVSLRQLLFGLLRGQVALHRAYQVDAGDDRQHDADHVPHVASVAGQVRHQLDEEGERREDREAPDERPPGAVAMAGEQPACGGQQRQRQREAEPEYAQLLRELRLAQPFAGVALERLTLLARFGERLPGLQRARVDRLDVGLARALGCLQRIELAGARHHLVVLRRLAGGAAGRDPVGESLAGRAVRVARRGQRQVRGLAAVGQGGRLAAKRRDALVERRRGAGIDELLERRRALDLRQVADQQAAEADQEAREQQRDQPEHPAIQPLPDAQAPEHRRASRQPPSAASARPIRMRWMSLVPS